MLLVVLAIKKESFELWRNICLFDESMFLHFVEKSVERTKSNKSFCLTSIRKEI